MKRLITTPTRSRNGGSTLTEVLISTMVLSIGVLSVGTLFPLSLARAIRANQITQATIHRYNCEALVEDLKLNSYWMFCVEANSTDATAFSNLDNHFPGAFGNDGGAASADVDNAQGIFGFTPGRDGLPGFVGDDDGNGIADTTPAGTPDPAEIGWSDGTYSDDQPIIDEAELQVGGFDTTKVVIDPYGWHKMSAANLGGAYTGQQNNFGGDNYPPDVGGLLLPRVNGGYHANNQFRTTNPRVRPMFFFDRNLNGAADANELPSTGGFGFTEAQAEELVTLQDQFATVIDTPFSNDSSVSTIDNSNIATIPPRNRLSLTAGAGLSNSDLADINAALLSTTPGVSPLKVQAIFFGLKNAANPIVWSETRFLIDPSSVPAPTPAIPAGSIGWNEDLPLEFQIERVVIQIQNLDFTWMITARLTSPPPTRPQMDVVIFHKRRYEADDERLYVATQLAGNRRVVEVTFPAGNPPYAKKGGWMFDVEHCFWYHIANLVEVPKNNPTKYIITLEHNIRDRYDGATDDPNKIVAVFMRGVVDVFPIGTK